MPSHLLILNPTNGLRQTRGGPVRRQLLAFGQIEEHFTVQLRITRRVQQLQQHRIKKFLGTNAAKTQIWCAVATYVLIAIVKKALQLKASLYTFLQILSVSV